MDRSALGVRLAEEGTDRGRLVRTAGDARDQLVQRALLSPDPKVRDLVGADSLVYCAVCK